MSSRSPTRAPIWIAATAAALGLHAGLLVLLPVTAPPAPDLDPSPEPPPLTRQPLALRSPPPSEALPVAERPTEGPPVAEPPPKARRARPRRPAPRPTVTPSTAASAAAVSPPSPVGTAGSATAAPVPPIIAPPIIAPPIAAPPIAAPPRPAVSALAAYRVRIGREIAAHRRYPRLARRQGRQGTVIVALRLDRGGALLDPPRVQRSLGYAPLDAAAVRMARDAAPYPPLPPGLDSLELRVPVRFRLR